MCILIVRFRLRGPELIGHCGKGDAHPARGGPGHAGQKRLGSVQGLEAGRRALLRGGRGTSPKLLGPSAGTTCSPPCKLLRAY